MSLGRESSASGASVRSTPASCGCFRPLSLPPLLGHTADEEWAMLLYETPDKTGNVLTKHYMDIVWEVDAKVRELEVHRSVPSSR